MKKSMFLIALQLSLVGNVSPRQVGQAQSDSSAPASHAAPASCLIVKHKGTVGRRLIFTVLIGVPIAPGANYDLVDSVDYKPEKIAYKGKELQAVEKQGVHVIVLEKNYKPESLDAARKSCHEGNGSPPSPQEKHVSSPGTAKNPD
jgi:hypothetical protein